MPAEATALPAAETPSGLKLCLGLPTVIGQSIASIGLTATAVIIIPTIYLTTGAATWICFVLSTVMIVLVALTISLFARHEFGPGALSRFVEMGLGRNLGLIAGWSLLLTYAANTICILGAFGDNVRSFLATLGVERPWWAVPAAFAFCALFSFVLASREVRGSTIIMLVTEVLSVSIILLLCLAVVRRHSLAFDESLFRPQPHFWESVRAGVLLSVLSFTGFESATTLGSESRSPLRTIPRALVGAPLIAGAFFIFAAYALTLGLGTVPRSVAESSNPLEQLAMANRFPGSGIGIAFGGCVCFLGAFLATLMALARVLFAQARDGLLPARLGVVHPKFRTPRAALVVSVSIPVLGCAILTACGLKAADIFDNLGTFAVCGFLLLYFLIAVAAPFYLRRSGTLTWRSCLIAVLAALSVAFVGVGSVYPPQPGVTGLMPWAFLTLFVIGAIGTLLVAYRRAPARAA